MACASTAGELWDSVWVCRESVVGNMLYDEIRTGGGGLGQGQAP